MPPSLSPAARRVARPLARRAVASARVLAPALLVCVLLALLRVRRVEALPEDASSSAPLADVRPAALPSDLIEGYHAGDDDALDAAMLAWLERTRASAASADPAPSPSTTTPPFVEGETGPRESPPRVAPASHLPVARAASVSRSRSNATASPFVRVEGARFALGCEPYAPVGWNTYTLIEQAARVPVGSFDADFSRRGRRQVVDMLDAAVAAGFNTVRTWAYAVGKHQAMQVAPGVYHEPLFEGLDWVLSEADKRSIKVILVLTDYWEYNGGVAQYLDWSGATRNANKNDFFTDRACKRMYEANARVLIERVNVFTGRRYRDDPAIFAWELINEPRCRGCANALQAWIEEMARFVKSLDPNHMLSTGEEGFYGAGALGSVDANPEAWALATGQRFVENHAPPEIDFAVTHLWPDNWGVFSLTGELRRNFSREWIAAHAKDARELLKKPLVLEEFGATGKSGGGGGVEGDPELEDRAVARRGRGGDLPRPAVASPRRRARRALDPRRGGGTRGGGGRGERGGRRSRRSRRSRRRGDGGGGRVKFFSIPVNGGRREPRQRRELSANHRPVVKTKRLRRILSFSFSHVRRRVSIDPATKIGSLIPL